MTSPLECAPLYLLGPCFAQLGQPERAIGFCEQATIAAVEADIPWIRSAAPSTQAQIAVYAGLPGAADLVHEGLLASIRAEVWFDVWPTVGAASHWLRSQGRVESASVIDGHLVANNISRGRFAPPQDLEEHLTDPAARQRGASMGRGDLIEFVLTEIEASPS